MKKNWLLRLLFLFVFPLVPHFVSPLQGLGFFLFRDIGCVYFPAKAFWARSVLQEGAIPQWNPYNFGGAPFLADLNFGVLHPLNVVFLFIPNIFWAYTLFTALHCVALAWACFYCFRKFNFGERAAVLAACSFSVSGMVFSACSLINVLGSFLAVPLFAVGIRGFSNGVWPKILLALSIAWPVYSGDPQYSYWMFLVFICFLVSQFASRQEGKDLRDGALILCGSFLLSAAQSLPTIGILYDSQRFLEPVTAGSAEFFTFRLSRLVELFVPFFLWRLGWRCSLLGP